MNIRSRIILAIAVIGILLGSGCKVTVSLSGASISPEAQTVSIPFFPNSAPMVTPTLSSTLTDALQERFANQTRLNLIREDGDLAFEGEIVGYTSTPTAVTADDLASQNRLTITVRVKFTNRFEPEFNFERTFSQFEDFNSTRMLQDEEPRLIPLIVEKLVEDIFNAAVSNW